MDEVGVGLILKEMGDPADVSFQESYMVREGCCEVNSFFGLLEKLFFSKNQLIWTTARLSLALTQALCTHFDSFLGPSLSLHPIFSPNPSSHFSPNLCKESCSSGSVHQSRGGQVGQGPVQGAGTWEFLRVFHLVLVLKGGGL